MANGDFLNGGRPSSSIFYPRNKHCLTQERLLGRTPEQVARLGAEYRLYNPLLGLTRLDIACYICTQSVVFQLDRSREVVEEDMPDCDYSRTILPHLTNATEPVETDPDIISNWLL